MTLFHIIGSTLLIATAAFGQKDTFVPANDVSFTISTEQTSYRTGEQIRLKYRITNVSNATLFVPREWSVQCPPSPHIWAWFEDSAGRHLVPGYAGDCFGSDGPLLERMKRETILLRPGRSVEGHLVLQTNLFAGMKPGHYRIEAELEGWNDKDFDQENQAELRKMGAPFLRGEVPASTQVLLQ